MCVPILCLAGGLLMSEIPPAETKPNILIITTDDQGYADLSCMGSKEIQTPHLDALAASGALCMDFYSNSPICSPSRAALLTGRFPAQAGVSALVPSTRQSTGLRPNIPTLASVLQSYGYRTFHTGKWHLGGARGSRPGDRGFEKVFGFLGGCVDYYSHLYYWGTTNPIHDLWENDKEVWHDGEYLTELITKKTLDAIDAAGDRPFFGYVAYNAPHYPLHAPPETVEKFATLPPDRQMMAAMLWEVDAGVGKILQRLRERGALDNTLIFFMSDNGPSREPRNWLNGLHTAFPGGSAAPFRGEKFTLWEGGIRVPAIFSWPRRIPGNQKISTPLMAVDVFPTILRAIGAPDPGTGLVGENLLPLLREGKSLAPRDLFWEHDGSLAIRRGPWKLIVTREQEEILVDLENDPGEKRNVRDRNQELSDAMKTSLAQWKSGLR